MRITNRPLRSMLYVPGDKPRALEKAQGLGCDAIIFDLEDAVNPDAKGDAREAVRAHFRHHPAGLPLRLIRINGLDTAWGTEDFLAARSARPDGLVIPKVNSQEDLAAVFDMLDQTDAPPELLVFGMIETAMGVANCAQIAQKFGHGCSRLAGFVVGTNDLFKQTGLDGPMARQLAAPWLMQVVLAGRAGGLHVWDGVFNDYSDGDGFVAHCGDGRARGFDGVSLIHPCQIDVANRTYRPSPHAVAQAQKIVAAFELPENQNKGVMVLDGSMVERLHLEQAQALLARAKMIDQTDG